MVAASGDLGVKLLLNSSPEPQLSSVMNKRTSIPRRMHIPNMAFSNLNVYLKLLLSHSLQLLLTFLLYWYIFSRHSPNTYFAQTHNSSRPSSNATSFPGRWNYPHSSILAWQIPWTEEPGRLQSTGSLGVWHDWATSLSFLCIGEGNGNPLVFLPGESQGRGSLVDCRLWGLRVGHNWSDLAAAAAPI